MAAKAEAYQANQSLFLATLDTQKAFDVVHRTILFDNKLIGIEIQKDV